MQKNVSTSNSRFENVLSSQLDKLSNCLFGLIKFNLIHIGNMLPGFLHGKINQEFEDGLRDSHILGMGFKA
jgi:hypothetical protein